ncbi:MAG: T9SS type A sorting domain-containing protein [candidate division WOR-3 bacterium]|nr:T9SS type A sorting domain-containing protein [candidate division WOR-3 bacterium]
MNANTKWRKLNTKSFLLAILLITTICLAQWRTYTNTNFINDIIGQGDYLYCATRGGLVVFSRTDELFVEYYTNVEGLPSNRINCLIFDKSQQIWLGTNNGLAIFNPNTKEISRYPLIDHSADNIDCLNVSGDTILVSCNNTFYLIDTKGTIPFSDDIILQPTLPSVAGRKIFSLQAGPSDFWIGTFPEGVIKYNRNLQNYTIYRAIGDSVKAMILIGDTLYVATEKSLSRFNGISFDTIKMFPQNYVIFDLKYERNHFYIATRSALFDYDRSNLFASATLPVILWEDSRCIYLSNGIWVGVGGQVFLGGGLRYYFKHWHYYFTSSPISNNVSCVVSDTGGTIYTTHYPSFTYNFKTISYKKGNEYWQLLRDTLFDGWVCAVDKQNRLWVGHWAGSSGISCYDPQTDSWSLKTWPGTRGVIGAFGIDNNDTKWTYNQDNKIIAITNNDSEYVFTVPGLSRPERHGYEFAFDSKNRVWLVAQEGIIMYDYNNTLDNPIDDDYKIYRTASEKTIKSIAIDTRDRVYIGTSQGLALLKDDSFQFFNTENILRVKTDCQDRVWYLTKDGLSMFNPYTQEHITYTKDNSQIIPNLDQDESFYQWLHIDNARNRILIATKEGISQFQFQTGPPAQLSEIKVFPNPFIVSKHQTLTFDNLPNQSIVKIYTLEGKLVTTLIATLYSQLLHWEPNNLPTGIYWAYVTSPYGRGITKFAIVR